MCIMEVRPNQHASTIAQALAHNVKTAQGDLEMFRKLLIARGDVETLARVEHAQVAVNTAYSELLDVFGTELAHDVDTGHNPDHGGPIGNERGDVIHSRPDAPCKDCGATGQHSHVHLHVRPGDRDMLRDAAAIAASRARTYETR